MAELVDPSADLIGRARTLVVDDDLIQARRNRAVLMRVGVRQCSYVLKYDHAISEFRKLRPQIVVPDVHLSPDRKKDGFALLEEMRSIAKRERWAQPYAIFITGFEVDEAKEKALSIPRSDFLEKPVADNVFIGHFKSAVQEVRSQLATADEPCVERGPDLLERKIVDWNEVLEAERVQLVAEEYDLLASGGELPVDKFERLSELQQMHGAWMRRINPLDTGKVIAALKAQKRRPEV